MFFRFAVYIMPRTVNGSVVHCNPVSLPIVSFALLLDPIQVAFALKILCLKLMNLENWKRSSWAPYMHFLDLSKHKTVTFTYFIRQMFSLVILMSLIFLFCRIIWPKFLHKDWINKDILDHLKDNPSTNNVFSVIELL